MSLRSTLTKLAASLSFVRIPWAGAVAAAGLLAWSAVGSGGCGGNDSLEPCPPNIGTGMCICDGLGCRPANQQGTGGNGSGGTATTTTTTTSGTGGSDAAAPCDPTQSTCPCDNGACPSGKVCINDLCIVGCNFSYECGSGNVCANGACVPGCDTSQPCATGYTCTNGACQLDPANPQCSASTPCPSPEVCSGGVCAVQCTTNSQCAAGDVCDGASNTCITNPSPTPVCSASTPCPTGEDCLSDGFCHYPCTTTAQCVLIDNRFTCSGGYCKTQEEINLQCTLTMPCPAGKTCISNTCF